MDVASAVGTIGTATRQIRKLTLTGTEDVYTVGGNAPFKVAAAGLKSPTLATVLWLCSHYMALPSNASWSEYSSLVSWQSGDGEALRFRDTACANATEFKAFLASEYSAGHPVEVWYVLAEPQTETFTSPTITPQKGANVLTVLKENIHDFQKTYLKASFSNCM